MPVYIMNAFILALGLFSLFGSSVSMINQCDVEEGMSCKDECAPTETEFLGFGILGCIAAPTKKCCDGRANLNNEPTTTATTEMSSPITTTSPEITQPSTTSEPTTSTTTQPPPPEQQCGISSSPTITARIFGGTKSGHCDWPWMVSIRSKAAPGGLIAESFPACSGVLIESNWVVTTAYCALKAAIFAGGSDIAGNMFVFAGEHNTAGTDYVGYTASEQVFGVDEVIIHENYPKTDLSSVDNDFLTAGEEANNIALLKLSHDAVFGDCVRKVCLPEAPANGECPELIKDCWTAGWGLGPENGYEKYLHEAEITVISADAWTAHTLLSGIDNTMKAMTLNGSFKNKTARACTDDNGGMVVCKKDATSWVLEGLINKPNFKDCKAPEATNNVMLTDITAAAEWIKERVTV